MIDQYWSWMLSILGGFSIYLAGKKDWRAWAITLLCELLWFIYAVTTKQYGFFVGVVIYGVIGTKNLVQWRREHKKRV